jgi:His/Glu/Gln/Arg/opine family amino acid ABC transporter permease subunit
MDIITGLWNGISRWGGYYETYIGTGFVVTVSTTVVGTLLTALWALVVTAFRISRVAPIRFIGVAYIEVFRGTPILVQLFTFFFALPIVVGLYLPAYPTAVLVLALNAGGYLAENYRAGFQAVPNGQREAAAALGMTRFVALRRVVVPQAIRIIVPAIGNTMIGILLTTPLTGVIGNPDMMFEATRAQGISHDFSVFALIAVIYVVLGLGLAFLNGRLERWLRLP